MSGNRMRNDLRLGYMLPARRQDNPVSIDSCVERIAWAQAQPAAKWPRQDHLSFGG
jgi:hypothetical protein